MVSSVGTCSKAGRPSSGDFEPRTAFLRQFQAPDVLPPAIPRALLHRTPKQSAAFQNCSSEIYFKTALSEQQLFNPPELSKQTRRRGLRFGDVNSRLHSIAAGASSAALHIRRAVARFKCRPLLHGRYQVVSKWYCHCHLFYIRLLSVSSF
ncbi:hypothetical protein KSP39_PZI007239 [Platanthera zijinensis]|uniref:Uncharacterized protein n=1 Tax=Platanthera zijinensis TaxID=2320716 RepID=A0AAP0GA87_9ASPA